VTGHLGGVLHQVPPHDGVVDGGTKDLRLTPNRPTLALEEELVTLFHALEPGSKVAVGGLAEWALENAARVVGAVEADEDGGGEGDLREGLRVAGEVPSKEGGQDGGEDNDEDDGVHGIYPM